MGIVVGAYVFGVLYGAKVEYDLTKNQNSWTDNKEEKLFYVCKN